jgi:hypothetical protein
MTHRLNLDTLLLKYEQNYGLTSLPSLLSPQAAPSRTLHKVKSDADMRRMTGWVHTLQEPTPQEYYATNFQMSRSECEKYLLGVRAELKREEQRI